MFANIGALQTEPHMRGFTWWVGGVSPGYLYQLLPLNMNAIVERTQMG